MITKPVNIYHFIPSHEESLHEVSNECRCEPTLVPSDNLEVLDEEYLIGETVFEHHPLSERELEHFIVKS